MGRYKLHDWVVVCWKRARTYLHYDFNNNNIRNEEAGVWTTQGVIKCWHVGRDV